MVGKKLSITPDLQVHAARMLVNGLVTATVTHKRTGQQITIEMRAKESDNGTWKRSKFNDATHVFVNVPNKGGGDRVGVYYPKTGMFWPADKVDQSRVFAFQQLVYMIEGKQFSNNHSITTEATSGHIRTAVTKSLTPQRRTTNP